MQTKPKRVPKSWLIEANNEDLYQVAIDDDVQYNGKPTVLVSSNNATHSDYLQLKQTVDGNEWYGKRVRISCFAKTLDFAAYATLAVAVKNPSGYEIVLDPMIDRALDATTDWVEIYSVIDVPDIGR